MSESVVFPAAVAEELVLPGCTSGYRDRVIDGFAPYKSTEEWFAIRRVSDGKLFVADYFDYMSDPRFEDDENFYITEFGEVRQFDEAQVAVDGFGWVTITEAPDVVFFEAVIETVEAKNEDEDDEVVYRKV